MKLSLLVIIPAVQSDVIINFAGDIPQWMPCNIDTDCGLLTNQCCVVQWNNLPNNGNSLVCVPPLRTMVPMDLQINGARSIYAGYTIECTTA